MREWCVRSSRARLHRRSHHHPRLDGYLASEYPGALEQLFRTYGCTPLGVGLHEHLEGQELGPITVIDYFPDIEAARAFWNDPEYQRIIPIRQQFSDAHVVLLDGAPPT